MNSCFVFQVPTVQESTLKGKNLLPTGSNFFPFSADPFQKGGNINIYRADSSESESKILLNPSHTG